MENKKNVQGMEEHLKTLPYAYPMPDLVYSAKNTWGTIEVRDSLFLFNSSDNKRHAIYHYDIHIYVESDCLCFPIKNPKHKENLRNSTAFIMSHGEYIRIYEYQTSGKPHFIDYFPPKEPFKVKILCSDAAIYFHGDKSSLHHMPSTLGMNCEPVFKTGTSLVDKSLIVAKKEDLLKIDLVNSTRGNQIHDMYDHVAYSAQGMRGKILRTGKKNKLISTKKNRNCSDEVFEYDEFKFVDSNGTEYDLEHHDISIFVTEVCQTRINATDSKMINLLHKFLSVIPAAESLLQPITRSKDLSELLIPETSIECEILDYDAFVFHSKGQKPIINHAPTSDPFRSKEENKFTIMESAPLYDGKIVVANKDEFIRFSNIF